jgi:hypothetical protein
MVNLTSHRDWGSLGLFILPGFRERSFAGAEGRLRPTLPVATDSARYESAAQQRHTDLALRYAHYLGDWDLGAYYFYGTGREPRLLPDSRGRRLIPFYDLIHQIGVDLQYTREAWLWKLEAIVREGLGDTFAASVAGFEYTYYQLGGSNADLGLLAEYLYDDRDPDPRVAPPTPFDDDLFIGTRLALNDAQDSSLLMGLIVDRDDRSRIYFIEAERRLGSLWTVELEGRWFADIDPTGDLAPLAEDSYLSLRVLRHF